MRPQLDTSYSSNARRLSEVQVAILEHSEGQFQFGILPRCLEFADDREG